MTTTSPSAVGYARVSTVSQVENGDGLGAQKDRITAWCRYQQIDLMQVHEDAGISGSAMENRPGLRSALRAVLYQGKGAVLVVYRLDRLGRTAVDVQEVLAVLLDAGVRVVSISDGIDSASGMGATLLKLLISILATFAELEKETIKTRLLDGRRRADANNKTYASEPRYGRHVSDPQEGTLAVHDDEAAAVARIHELHAEGRSYREIAVTLDAEGHRPRRAGSWSHVVVGRIASGKRTPKKPVTARRIERARAWLLGEDSEQKTT
jgi:DNA invertase Pin-like site-specific DNA recombinase